jgi:hypothetical protein
MSDWPKRYRATLSWWEDEESFHCIGQNYGEWVKHEDFEMLLLYTVEVVRRSPRFDWVNASGLKDAVLRDIETWKKQKDTPGV